MNQQEVQKVVLSTLIQFGLLPDPISGMYDKAPSNHEFLQMLSGGHSSDARQAEPTTQPLTLETDTTALSNLIYRLGTVMEEVDSLINILMRHKRLLRSAYGSLANGVHGLDAVEILDLDKAAEEAWKEANGEPAVEVEVTSNAST